VSAWRRTPPPTQADAPAQPGLRDGLGQVADRLRGLGLVLPAVAAPVGAYAPAVYSHRLGNDDLMVEVQTSGQLPFVDGRLTVVGTVGGEVTVDGAGAAARTAALNAVAAVAAALVAEEDCDDDTGCARSGGTHDRLVAALERVVRVVKMTGYVASAPGFVQQPAVLDMASELLHGLFGDAGVHARAAVGVAALPMGAPVEVELLVVAEPA